MDDGGWRHPARGISFREFTRTGGSLEMVQLWVNLPAQHKRAAPRYQTLRDAQIPTVELPSGAGRLRVIAGRVPGSARSGADLHAT